VLLALRSIVKQDLGCSPAELIYGTTLRLPVEFYHTAQPEPGLPDLIGVLKDSLQQLRATPGTDHSKVFIHMPEQFQKVSRVFLRVDATQKPFLGLLNEERFKGRYYHLPPK